MKNQRNQYSARGFISAFAILAAILASNNIVYAQSQDFTWTKGAGGTDWQKGDLLSKKKLQKNLYDDMFPMKLRDSCRNLKLIETADAENVELVGHFDTGDDARGVAVSGGYAYVADGADGLRVIDISDPTNPFEAGYFDTGSLAKRVAANGGYTYVGDFMDGLRVIDVSNPTNPFEASYFDTGGNARGVALSGGYAYVADGGDGLRVIDISDPTNPFEAGYFDTGGNALDVAVSGGYAYVADFEDGLRVIDISDPTNPFEAGYFDTGSSARGVAVNGGYAYVGDFIDGLRVIDISDPTNPFETGYFDTGSFAWGVAVSGGYAYVADGFDGLRVIDISDPTNPFETGYFDTGDYAWDVTVSGGYAYVADGYDGLYILRYVESSDFDLGFRPNPDGWQFGNTESNMWPEEWWSQFDYSENPYLDPGDPWYINSSKRFPDWFLFVDAFGEDQCYFHNGVISKPSAYLSWWVLSYPEFRFPHYYYWKGSCFGFAISSFLFFDELLSISDEFPGYTNTYDVPINDDSRKFVNLYWIYQFGINQLAHINANKSKTPAQTLDECKQMFLSETRDDKILVFFNQNGGGGHAVNPFRIETDPDDQNIEYIYVYDNNYPDDDAKRIKIDLINNSWDYEWIGDGNWGGNAGLFLMDPASNYLTNPILPKSLPPKDRYISKLSSKDYIEIYNTTNCDISIHDPFGNTIGYSDSATFNNFEDGIPIIPITGSFQPPIGYFIPKLHYAVQMQNFTDSLCYFSVFTDSSVYNYKRSNVLLTQTDEFTYGDGLSIKNQDVQNKIFSLQAIILEDDNEKVFQVDSCEFSQNDSMKVKISNHQDYQILNYGVNQNYDLKVRLTAEDTDLRFEHNDIDLSSNASHLISPDWDSLETQPVQILIDENLDGIVDDTLYVYNEYYIKGDINKDGEVDIFDLVKLINFILEKVEPDAYEFWAGDINDDGELDIFDVVKMINIILEGDSTVLAKMVTSPAHNGELTLLDVELVSEHTTEVPLWASFDGTVAGIQLVLRYDPQALKVSTPVLTSRTEQMELASADKNGKLTLLIYSASGNVIEAGNGAILNFAVQALSRFKGATQLKIEEVIAVDSNAEAISVNFSSGNIVAAKPKIYFLAQNYPNPFNAQTIIKYQLPQSDRVVLKIYNNLGQEIRTLVDKEQDAGYYTVNWDGRNNEGIRVSSGIYIYRIQAGDFVRVKKMLFVM